MKRQFDHILDECLERILVRGEKLEDCLRDYPEHAGELKKLLDCVLLARTAADIQPRPDFRARAKAELLAAVREAKARKSRRFFIWQPVWGTVTAVVLVFILASSVTVAAAGNSMPDEPLYPIKVASERARLTLTPSPLGKAEFNAELADRRVAEIVHLASKGKFGEIEAVTERLNRSLERIVELTGGEKKVALAPAPVQAPAPRPAPLAAPPPKPATVTPTPTPSLPRTPPPPRPAAATPVPRDQTGAAGFAPPLSPKPTPPPAPKSPAVATKTAQKSIEKQQIRAAVAQNAARNQEKLREALRQAPESAKPALRRALAISEKGYQRAAESLGDDGD